MSGPRRILMTTDAVGGVWTYALELCRALAPRGVHVVLACMGGRLSAQQLAAAARLLHVRLHQAAFKLEWMQEPWDDVEAAGLWLQRLAREFQPDVVHLNQFAFGSLPFAAPVLVVGHSCVRSWHVAVHGRPAPASWQRYTDVVTAGLRGADLVTAPSAAMLAELARHYGPFRAGPHVYNGRSAADFPPGEKRPYFFTAGRLWDSAKNVAAVARVAPHLAWPVRVAGPTHHPDGGGASFDGVHMLGKLEPAELAAQLARAAVCVQPARYEPFGLLPLEAALAGCALVLGDIPSQREIWDDAALYVRPDDDDHLRDTLLRLQSDRDLVRAMADAARARAARYTPERMADETWRLYERMLDDWGADHHADRQAAG